MKLLSLLVIVAGCLSLAGSLNAADRVALVIGNGSYTAPLQRLDACPRDAAKMAAAFKKIGIRVYGGKPLIDLDADQIDAALNDFARSLGRDSEAFIYYSGHGAQIGGSNFLLPVGFNAKFESQARRQAVSLDAILDLLERTQSKLRVVILDSCRDPGAFLPGEAAMKGPTRSKGLSDQKVDAPETLVCFATKHGTAALADDTSSYYTRVLSEEIIKPGKVEDVMKAVARRVYSETDQKQLPFTYGSLLQDHFFVPGSPTTQDLESEIQRRVKAQIEKLGSAKPLTLATTPGPTSRTSATPGAIQTVKLEMAKPPSIDPNSTPPLAPAPSTSSTLPPSSAPPELPPGGFFPLERIFDGPPYAAYNSYTRSGILQKAQEKLKAAGIYRAAPDGKAGRGTEEAIIEWQRQRQLPVSGRMDRETLSSLGLEGLPETSPPARQPERTVERPVYKEPKPAPKPRHKPKAETETSTTPKTDSNRVRSDFFKDN